MNDNSNSDSYETSDEDTEDKKAEFVLGGEEEEEEAASDYDTDGSNLAIYSKASINDTTRLQYVTGHREKFTTRKRMYEEGNVMDKMYEGNSLDEPSAKIAKLESQLIGAGVRCEYAGQNGTVAYADYNTVKNLLKQHLHQ